MPGKKRTAAGAAVAAAPAAKKTKTTAAPKPHKMAPAGGTVAPCETAWWDCMLNQTNVDANNNKFYVIQVLAVGSQFVTFTCWGRVGEPGSTQELYRGADLKAAGDAFKKKFKDKTKNDWDKRDNFKAAAGKYTLIEMDHTEEDAGPAKVASPAKSPVKVLSKPSKLPKQTQETIHLIFDSDMFKDQMKQLDLDVDKMPLGKLSKDQVNKGTKILEQLEKALDNGKSKEYGDLTSQYYTSIPHNFGRKLPPKIDSKEKLQKEFDLLNVLSDIQTALQTTGKASDEHPDDVNYKALNTKLTPIDPKSKEFKVIETYTQQTQGYRKCKIIDAFAVDRSGEGAKFKENAKIKERKLLWHGTSVAVVVAILKTGLRIMPHSGGRVGRGLYFASENGKSAGYVGTTGSSYRWGGQPGTGFMFLVEVALGKENEIKRDDSSLKSAPSGFDCVVARGRTEPDPTKNTTLKFDGNDVVVPQGKPINQPQWKDSSFMQSEYLIYKESQARIRYMLKMKF